MRNNPVYILFVLSVFLTVACVPSRKISFDSLQPAGFSIPPTEDSILVLNLSYYPWADTSSFSILNKLENPEAYIIDTMIIKSIFDGLFSVLDNSEFSVLNKTIYGEIRENSHDNFLEPIDLQSVNLMCEDFKVDLIISLEYYGMNYNNEYIYEGEDRLSLISIKRKLVWRVYEKDLGMIDEYEDKDTLYWKVDVNSLDIINNKFPELISLMKDAFWYGGEKYAYHLSPKWVKKDRPYFNINYDFENISLDEEGLTRYLLEKDKKIKSYKSWYNLAVFYEKEGFPENAMIAIEKALQIRPNANIAKEFESVLKKESVKKAKLDKQLDSIFTKDK